MTSHWIKIDGQPATTIGACSPLTWETLADGGCGEASFSVEPGIDYQHPSLQAGRVVNGMLGAHSAYVGQIIDCSRETGVVTVQGLYGSGQGYRAIDGSGNATLNTATAVIAASNRGWPIFTSAITGTALGDTSSGPLSVPDVLSALMQDYGLRWRIDGRGHLTATPDPTTPKWVIKPGAAAFGTTTEGVASHYFARYFDGTNYLSTPLIAHPQAARMPHFEESVDLTDRGTLTLFQATSIVTAALGLQTSRYRWTNGVTLTRDQITTIGGTPAPLEMVKGGQMVRVHGVAAFGFSSATWQDFVIGKTKYTAGDDVIYLEPVGIADRTLRAAIAAG